MKSDRDGEKHVGIETGAKKKKKSGEHIQDEKTDHRAFTQGLLYFSEHWGGGKRGRGMRRGLEQG